MTQFDALLRQGLMDANLVQYESIFQQIETPPGLVAPSFPGKPWFSALPGGYPTRRSWLWCWKEIAQESFSRELLKSQSFSIP